MYLDIYIFMYTRRFGALRSPPSSAYTYFIIMYLHIYIFKECSLEALDPQLVYIDLLNIAVV